MHYWLFEDVALPAKVRIARWSVPLTSFRIALLLLLALGAAPCRAQREVEAPGCGPDEQKFDVANSRSWPKRVPLPGKAMIVVLQNDADFDTHPKPTTRVGLDGDWLGAVRSSTYLLLQADPGEHHLCASWQQNRFNFRYERSASSHFVVESGHVYYFQIHDFRYQPPVANVEMGHTDEPDMTLDPIEKDAAEVLLDVYDLSVSRLKR